MPRIRQDEIDWADATTLMGLIAILILCALAALLFLQKASPTPPMLWVAAVLITQRLGFDALVLDGRYTNAGGRAVYSAVQYLRSAPQGT